MADTTTPPHLQKATTTTDPITTLPPNKRYILTHSPQGKSIIHSAPPQEYTPLPGFGGVARSFATASIPIPLAADADVSAYLSDAGPTSHTGRDIVIPTKQGSNLVILDIVPGGVSYMHRTVSVDYSICTNGHVRMEMDSGEVVHLFPGDHVIQRGTNHKWLNGSQTEPARLIAVTLPCEPFEILGTGKMLEEEYSVE